MASRETTIPGIKTRRFGERGQSAITELTGTERIGNTVVRCCTIHSSAVEEGLASGLDKNQATEAANLMCRTQCELRDLTVPEYRTKGTVDCPEKNTHDAYVRLGVEPNQAITVAVTGNGVGFDDMFSSYVDQGVAGTNPEGWREARGFNAFFVDTSSDTRAIGRRLADCGDLNIEFQTKDGRTIIGFMHLTRPNQMMGKGVDRFGADRDQSYFEYAMRLALSHYGEVDLGTVSLSLRTAIEAHDFVKRFSSTEAMEGHLPGWYDDGLLKNTSNPEWKAGDEHNPDDVWHADFKGIVMRDLHEGMENIGLNQGQLDVDEMVDTMHSPEHSSHERAKTEDKPDTRDLYVTVCNSARTIA